MSPFDNSFGAWFVGLEVSNVAFGFVMLQIWIFCQNWQSEPLIFKFVVLLILVMSFLLVFLTSHGLYYYLVSSIGDLAALNHIIWSFKAEPWVSEAMVTTVHLFYTGRIFYINRSYPLLALLFTLTLAHFVLDNIAAGLNIKASSGSNSRPSALIQHLPQAGLSIDLVIDVIVMVAMFRFFYRSDIGLRRTRKLINRLALYTFASGFLTVVASAVILALFITKPTTQTYSGASFVLPHLYGNCLLALLNSRGSLRDKYLDEVYVMDSSVIPPMRFHVPKPVVTNDGFSRKGAQSNELSTGLSSSNFSSMGKHPTLTPSNTQTPSPALHV